MTNNPHAGFPVLPKQTSMKENEMFKQLKEQLQINLLQVFEDVNLSVEGNHSNAVRDQVLDQMCTVIINTVGRVPCPAQTDKA